MELSELQLKRKMAATFLKIVRGIIGQQCIRSVNKENSCVYRGKNGLKCAVGHLIPDREYHVEFEGKGVVCMSDNYDSEIKTWLLNHFPIEMKDFLRDCQNAHDGMLSNKFDIHSGKWAKEMLEIANNYQIKSPAAIEALKTVIALAPTA